MHADDSISRETTESAAAGRSPRDRSSTVAPSPRGEAPGAVRLGVGVGDRVGRYELLERLGEGGFGVVFRARQSEPVRRDVAIKILKLGMDTERVVARFEAERRVLARMEHPGIATVFDAGSTDTGRPYFVMALVRGRPIDRYCDENALDLPTRVELVRQAARAVQHAHQKGVIHRDLKCSNVLVCDEGDGPRPVVIDFGVAKLLGEPADADERGLTIAREDGFVGTPLVMSPEQFVTSGDDVDTRTDVYGLGVILYELLCGEPSVDPSETRGRTLEEIGQLVARSTPLRPSLRLERSARRDVLAERRSGEARSIVARLRGELDWITMKALARQREDRYDGVRALEEDLGRALAGDAVLAGPPSQLYRLRTLVRRNRGVVAAIGAVAAALVLGLVGTSVGLIEAMRENERANALATSESEARREAEQRALELSMVSEFQAQMIAQLNAAEMGAELRESMLDAVEDGALDRGATPAEASVLRTRAEVGLEGVNFVDVARGALDRNLLGSAASVVRQRFANAPLVQIPLLQTLARAYRSIGMPEHATELARAVLAVLEESEGWQSPRTLVSAQRLAHTLMEQGHTDEPVELLERTLEAIDEQGPTNSAWIEVRADLARGLQRQGHAERAIELSRVTAMRTIEQHGEANAGAVFAQMTHASILRGAGRLDDARAVLRAAREALDRARNVNPAIPVIVRREEAILALEARDHAEALAAFEEVRAQYTSSHGGMTTAGVETLRGIARALAGLERYDEALARAREALAIARRELGSEHRETMTTTLVLGEILMSAGKATTARSEIEAVIAAAPADRSPIDACRLALLAARSAGASGDLDARAGHLADAERLLAEARATGRDVVAIDGLAIQIADALARR